MAFLYGRRAVSGLSKDSKKDGNPDMVEVSREGPNVQKGVVNIYYAELHCHFRLGLAYVGYSDLVFEYPRMRCMKLGIITQGRHNLGITDLFVLSFS
jgi:hypothetical protein